MATTTGEAADQVEIAGILGIEPDETQWMTEDEILGALGKLQPEDEPALIH